MMEIFFETSISGKLISKMTIEMDRFLKEIEGKKKKFDRNQ